MLQIYTLKMKVNTTITGTVMNTITISLP